MKYLILFFSLLATLVLNAELVFETTSVDGGVAKLGEKEFVAKFPFKNTGDSTITILSAKSSCGCTVPALAKKVYAPGESGEITATFSFDARTGHQQKTISVITDSEPKRATLRLEITIPEIMTIKPRVVFWNVGSEPLEAKQFQVVLGENVEADVRLIGGDNPEDFNVTIVRAESGVGDYTVTVEPKVEKPGRAKFKLGAFDANDKLLADSYAFAIIRVARTSGKELSGKQLAPQAP
ncbi:DUF1573 domain-containing protein [Cerasicoccus frondis]|uniref:DUF1573 domain-containing protein n=1 Tax=Cerasicoccus frondis TaxID=490090 RepID=UPI002852714C|nr:DUF1573 domain-containing protein [Cerasicoccus frondis]